jgi:ribose-phosphate pyrophosphokinase
MKSSFIVATNTICAKSGAFYNHGFNTKVFSGGEINIQIPEGMSEHDTINIDATIMDAEGLMTLAMLKDALDREAPYAEINLYMGYVPYARQDRVCNRGEALSIKVFCDMINAMEFDSVCILDPHSDVTPALLDRCFIIEPTMAIEKCMKLSIMLRNGDMTLVAPDAGATKKVDKVAVHFGGLKVIQGMKKRDLKTGKLSGFGYMGDVEGKHLLIVDDICDGGGTFLGLAAKLRQGGAKTISLYVSHGIFSKGIEMLIDNGIDQVYTTDSCNHGQEHENLQVVNWI